MWSWQEFRALPSEEIRTDIHCVTKWSKRRVGRHPDTGGEDVETWLVQLRLADETDPALPHSPSR